MYHHWATGHGGELKVGTEPRERRLRGSEGRPKSGRQLAMWVTWWEDVGMVEVTDGVSLWCLCGRRLQYGVVESWSRRDGGQQESSRAGRGI